MKKQEKIDLIRSCIGTPAILRMYFTYDDRYWYYYPNAVSDSLVLGQEEGDFLLDGYHVRKLSQLKKVEVKDDLCSEINRWNGVSDTVRNPGVDVSSWASVFSGLMEFGKLVMAEDAINGQLELGFIRKLMKSGALLETVDADGVWSEDPIFVPYRILTHVAWDTRYTDTWHRYLRDHGRIPVKEKE